MKVAFVSDFPETADRPVAGVESVVVRLSSAMARRGDVEVHAITFDGALGEARTDDVAGVRVHRFPRAMLGNVTFGWHERRVTARALRDLAPDVAHVHWLGPPALGAADSGVPWVATAHGMQEAEGKTLPGLLNRVRAGAYAAMERMSLRELRHLIVISPYVLDYFGDRLRGVRTYAIENPVADEFFDVRGPGDPRTILFTGRLIPRKDVETLLDAAGRLAAEGREFRLRIAGAADDPAYEAELRRRALGHNVAACVDFLGPLGPAAIAGELARAGVLAMPSRQETAPVSVMEAMAAGLPVVATDAGGTRWIVEGGVSGTLVPIGDDASLADALRGYLDDPIRARAHGAAGRRIAQSRFRLDTVVDRTLGAYRGVIDAARAPETEKPLDRDRVIA
jgi:glycosyltransferase involved in cell wall biosynthesis